MAEERRCPDDLSMWGEKKTSVPEVRAFLDALGAPDRAFRVIHVAGTNGKGSVCAYLTEALRRAGYRVGTFVSPHLVDIRERILIDGKMVASEDFRAAAEIVRREGEATERAGGNFPAYFEYLYYMAMLLFRDAGCEVAVLETGLGGRLDATNSCAPWLTVLTSISLDHMQYLGDTVEKIAAEKAGIIKKGVPVVYLDAVPSVTAVIADKAREMQADAYPVSPKPQDTRFAFLPAAYQRENAALAEAAFEVLKTLASGDALRRLQTVDFPAAVRATVWTGRMQELKPNVFLDGAHNADGVRRMAEAGAALAAQRGKKPLLLTTSVQDKELHAIAETFVKVLQPTRIYLAPLASARKTSEETLEALYREAGGTELCGSESVAAAYRRARAEQGEDEILFIAGSLYLIGEILAEEGK